MKARRATGESRATRQRPSAAALTLYKSPPRWKIWGAAAIIVAAGLAAYANSFQGPFVYDDTTSIPKNPHIRRLWPIWEAMRAPPQQTVAGRPILSLSLALNYAACELDVRGYHAGNLIVHVLSAVVLFGLIRRTLLTDRMRERFGGASLSLGLTCALIWAVHPLQTSSVTYIIQRAESLMGLFYLLTFYCAARGFASLRGRWWYAAAVASCVLGMGTKEVTATAPLLVLLYDRTFVSRSFREAIRRRWGLYLALASTWGLLAALMATAPRSESVGFGFDISALDYARTQCNVIVLYYLKLSFFPHPLVFDYGWPIARRFVDFAPAGLALAVLLIATAAALRYRPEWGFLGAWFFLILGPSSSFLPIASEVAAEHRMYLPLAAVVACVVTGAYLLGRRAFGERALPRRLTACALTGAVVLTLSVLTARRNLDYRTKVSIWEDTIEKRPDNHRAHNNLGVAYWESDQLDRAIGLYDKALELNPRYSYSYNNRGIAYEGMGEWDRAIRDFDTAIELNPKYILAYSSRAVAYEKKGEWDKAIRDYTKALELDPNLPSEYSNRGAAYAHRGDFDLAIADYERAIALAPRFAPAYNNRAIALGGNGDWDGAVRDYSKAVELDPDYVSAYVGRGGAHKKMRRWDLAIGDFTLAIERDPNSSSAYTQRGITYGEKSQWDRAIADYDRASELDPNVPRIYNNRGIARGNKGQWDLAIGDYDRAVQLDPNFALAFNNRGLAYKNKGLLDLAIRDYGKAVALNPTYAFAYNNRGIAYGQKGDFRRAVLDFDKAIELDPTLASAHNNRGIARGRMGDYARAVRDFTKVIELDPANAGAYNNRGGAREKKGDHALAVSDYRRAIELNPNYALAYSNLAAALLQVGKPELAVRNYRRALSIRSDYPAALRNLVWILAANPDAPVRDGAEAVRLGERDCELTGYEVCEALDALGAAQAEAGRFALAVETARKARQLALAAGKKDLANEIDARLKLYEAARPYRRPPASRTRGDGE